MIFNILLHYKPKQWIEVWQKQWALKKWLPGVWDTGNLQLSGVLDTGNLRLSGGQDTGNLQLPGIPIEGKLAWSLKNSKKRIPCVRDTGNLLPTY